MRRAVLATFGPGLTVLALWLTPAVGLRAQEPPLLGIQVVEASGTPRLELGDIFRSGGIRESLESGLPVRIEIVTELWLDRFFDSQERRDEWRATVWYDPLSGSYRIETEDTAIGRADSPEDALELLRREISIDLAPSRSGSYYYLGRIEIATLSLSDLEELRRWLKGELAPAIDGDEDVGGALGRGIRRLFVRALGLPALRFQTRSPEFDWGG